MNIERLPNEILLQVFSEFSELKDIRSVSLVCQLWSNIVKLSPCLNLSSFNEQIDDGVIGYLTKFRSVKKLNLTNCFKVSKFGLTTIKDNFPLLKELSLANMNLDNEKATNVAAIIESHPNLEVLHLQNNQIEIDGLKHLLHAIDNHKKIRELNLNSNKLGHVGVNLLLEKKIAHPSLKTIFFSGNKHSGLTPNHLVRIKYIFPTKD